MMSTSKAFIPMRTLVLGLFLLSIPLWLLYSGGNSTELEKETLIEIESSNLVVQPDDNDNDTTEVAQLNETSQLPVHKTPEMPLPAEDTQLVAEIEVVNDVEKELVALVEHNDPHCRYLYGSAVSANEAALCDLRGSYKYTLGKWVKNCDLKGVLAKGSQHQYAYSEDALIKYSDAGGTAKSKSCNKWTGRANNVEYYWQPETCALQPFDSNVMRDMLTKHKMLMVGDSLMGQMWESMQLLSDYPVSYVKSFLLVNHRTLTPMNHADIEVCQRLRDRILENSLDTDMITQGPAAWMSAQEAQLWETQCPLYLNSQYHRALSTLDWPAQLNDTKVLVLMTGHHWQREETPLGPKYEVMVANLVKYLEDANYQGKIIISTSPVGHENCIKYKEPYAATPKPTATRYNWERVTTVEHMWQEAFDNSPLNPNSHILNISFSILRPDAHFVGGGDCLHYCTAGLPDTWVHVLYNLLLQVL